jgi:para-nitrobenzyl esterase
MMRTYWTDFAKTGNPNGPGLPNWPVYSEAKLQMLHIASGRTQAGPIVDEVGLKVLDEYFAWRRAGGADKK